MKLLVFILIIFSVNVYADYSVLTIPDDKKMIIDSLDVVVGDVVDQERLATKKNQCFDYVYKIKIINSFKNQLQIGEIVEVGLKAEFPDLKIGDRYLSIIMNRHDDFYSWCKNSNFPKRYSKEKILKNYADRFFKVDIDKNDFFSYACNTHLPFMEEKYFVENGAKVGVFNYKGLNCRIMEGSYTRLVEIINDTLNQNKAL